MLPDTKYIILLSAGKLVRRLEKATVYEFLMQKKYLGDYMAKLTQKSRVIMNYKKQSLQIESMRDYAIYNEH
jgi:hypothetical protein